MQQRPHDAENRSRATNDADDAGLPLEPIDGEAMKAEAADDHAWWAGDPGGADGGRGGKLVAPTGGPGVVQPSRLHCSSCRYDLTGLTMAGRCPECGQSVQRSLRDQAAAARELSGLAVASVVFGALALGTAGCLAPVAAILGVLALRETKRGRASNASRTLAQVGIGLAALAVLLGLLWLVAL